MGKVHTFCDLGGEEVEVLVYFDASPPERDVNWPGDFEVTHVVRKDTNADVTQDIESIEFEALSMRVQEDLYADNSRY